ncbi:MAG: glycosyltransferase [Actinomycetota bacterium]
MRASAPGADAGRLHRPALLVMSPSADLYGSDRSLLQALPGLAAAFDITLLAAAEGPLLDEARALGVDCIATRDWALRRSSVTPAGLAPTARNVTSTLRLARRLHRERRFAAVYVNTLANATLPALRRALGIPVVVHVRELPRDRPGQLSVLLGMLDRAATRVICNSGFTARQLLELRPSLADRVRVVLNSVHEPERERVRPDADQPLQVVCVGRLHPKKGQAVLIDAAAQAVAAGADWHLHFWGEALPEHQELADALRAQVADGGLEGRVTWHGYSSVTDDLYDNGHVAVVPSVLSEEFSLVTAEAQIRGLPVVATGPGGPSEIVIDGESGSIVPPGDAAALRRALEHLDQDRDLLECWGDLGERTSRERFGIARYQREVVLEIEAVIDDRPGMLVLTPSADLYGSDRALLHALPAITEQVRVVVLSAVDGPFVDQARAAGASVRVGPDFAIRRRQLHPIRGLAMAGRTLATIRTARSLIKRHDLGTVYVNTVAVAPLPLMRMLRRPVVLHVHERALGGRLETFVLSHLPRFAHHVLANSEFTRSTFAPSIQRQSEVVYNGVAVPPDPFIVPDSNRIVVPARIHPKKGQPVLVDAVAQLTARGVDVQVDLVGDALPEHAELERALRAQITELGLDECIRLLGHKSDVEAIYAGYGIAIVPSVAPEEFSLVAAEAQIRGLAVVATGPGGVCEVVVDEQTGIIVPARDPAGLADGIERLLTDPERRSLMGERGRHRMLERFTVDTYRARLLDAITPFLSTRR